MTLLLALLALQAADSADAIASRVEIVRTEYGVPHILAADLKAMGFGLGYVQSEDYGTTVAAQLVRSRGVYARHAGIDSIEGDFGAREAHAIAVETFHRLDPRVQDVYEGFAEGVNHYLRLHPGERPEWIEPDFTAIDAHARDVQTWSEGDAAAFVRRYDRERGRATDLGRGDGGAIGAGTPGAADASVAADHGGADALPASTPLRVARLVGDDTWRPGGVDPRDLRDDAVGSNAWALDGSRTDSGHAFLLRNPHLAWDAGYYEAHVRVPGVVDFYGDFRIGGAFGIIGGFNEHLGWATTNNYARYSQVYALRAHPELADYAVLDDAPLPLERRTTTVEYRKADGNLAALTETTWWTDYGPVIHRADGWIFVLKDPRYGEFRRGEQFLRMMLAEDRAAWLEVMRMRAHSSSNFTYADAAGTIMMYYNARLPALPHEMTGDTAAVANSVSDIWSELAPWEQLPLYVNPPGGYVLQSNDTPDFINLNVHLDRDTVVANLPDPRFRLRSQLSYSLISGDEKLSLEEMIALKHSPRMLLAERVLDDLLGAARASGDASLGEATEVLAGWDRTAAVDSRGGVLFKYWANRYLRLDDSVAYAEPWSAERPAQTPRGIGSTAAALDALRGAVADMRADGHALDVPWGDVHRVVRGDVDVPVAGCEGVFGCFRTLSFGDTGDGRFAARSGDGWVLAVEFGDVPRAYSVLAYGESAREDSPHHADQAAMFARGELKPVAWTDADLERTTVRRYHPGEERDR